MKENCLSPSSALLQGPEAAKDREATFLCLEQTPAVALLQSNPNGFRISARFVG